MNGPFRQPTIHFRVQSSLSRHRRVVSISTSKAMYAARKFVTVKSVKVVQHPLVIAKRSVFRVLSYSLFFKGRTPQRVIKGQYGVDGHAIPTVNIQVRVPLRGPYPKYIMCVVYVIVATRSVPQVRQAIREGIRVMNFSGFFRVYKTRRVFLFSMDVFRVGTISSRLI